MTAGFMLTRADLSVVEIRSAILPKVVCSNHTFRGLHWALPRAFDPPQGMKNGLFFLLLGATLNGSAPPLCHPDQLTWLEQVREQ